MPQKRIRKTPIVLAVIGSLVLILSVSIVWSIFGNAASTLISAADLSLTEIEYATVRVRDEKGSLKLKKISSEQELLNLYDSLSHVEVEKRVSFGTSASAASGSISVKLKGERGLVRLSSSGNCFSAQNSGLLSPFFVCYYDVTDGQEFSELINSLTA